MAGKAGKPVSVAIGATLSSSLGSTVRDAKSQLGRLGSAISDLDKKKAGVEQLQRLKTETNELGRSYGLAKKRSEELRRAFTAAGPPTRKQAEEMQKAERATDKARVALDKQRQALRELGTSLRSAGTDTKNLASESARLGGQLEKLQSRTQALQRAQQAQQANRERRSQYLGGMMSAVAVGASLAAPAKVSLDFEAQMSRVGAIGGMTEKQTAGLTAKARELGRATRYTAVEVGQGMEYLTMAGFNAQQTVQAIGGVLDVAAAAGTDLGRTSDIVSNVLTGFGLTADQSERVGDVLTKTFTSSNTTLESLGETMKYVAPVAKSAGASIELVAAMAGVLGDAGIQGSMAGTTLRNTFLRLIAPSKDASKHMKQLGISAEEMAEIMADPEGQNAARYIKKMGIDVADEQGNLRDWMDILTELSVKMGNLSEAERLEAANSIFGKYAVSGGLAILDSLKNDEAYIEAQIANMREQGATEEEIERYRLATRAKLQDRLAKNMQASQERTAKLTAARQMDNAKGDLIILGAAVSDLGIAIGNVLSPSIRDSAQHLTVLANKAGALVERFPRLSKAVFLSVGAVLALTIGTYALGFAWTVLKEPFLRMNTVFRKVRAEQTLLQISNAKTGASATLMGTAWGKLRGGAKAVPGALTMVGGALLSLLPAIGSVSAAFLTCPLTWIVLGIAAVVVGAALLIRKYWDPISAWLGGVWEGIKEGFQPVLDAFSPLEPMLTAIGDAIGAVVGWFGSLLEPVHGTKEEMDAWAESGRSFGKILGGAFDIALTPIKLMAEGIGKVIEAAMWLRDHSQEIGATVKGWKDNTVNAVGDAWKNTKGAVSGGWNKAMSWVGLGDDGDDKPAPSRAAARPVAARSVTTSTTNAPVVNITVPPGAPAREIAQAAMDAVMDVLRGTSLDTAGLYD